jgi:hypothetical protein
MTPSLPRVPLAVPNAGAKVLIVKFADYQCPACGQAYIQYKPVLAKYAASQRAGGAGWHFLTGDPAKIERVCNAFGIQYWAEEGLITHSLQTAVIDREGRLAATVEGKDFTPTQLGDLVGAVLDARP